MTDPVLAWLLDTDPALRWQVERDLLETDPSIWQATRARVATEGFGARLLALQDPDGQWAGGSFFPRGFREDDFHNEGQPWTATTWSLNSLREWGVEAEALGRTATQLHAVRWDYEDLPYWQGEVDCCINSWTLSNGLWLGVDVRSNAYWFVEHRQPDGGWNCEWVEGSARSSFPSTLNSLKGLLDYERACPDDPKIDAIREARHGGEEYLLSRALLYRASTGDLIGPWALVFESPIRWQYHALNAVDYFRRASQETGTPPDPRLAEAVAVVRGRQQPDGRWLCEQRPRGRVWFDIDAGPGEPSPWLTFLALRVLHWWDAAHS